MRKPNIGSARCFVVKRQGSEIDSCDVFWLDLVFIGEKTNTGGHELNLTDMFFMMVSIS